MLSHLKDHKIVRILLPVQAKEPLARECVARVTSAPFFEAVFLDGELPAAQLDLEGRCRIFFDAEGRSRSITARIEEVLGANKLRLQAIESTGFVQKREYFRVDTEIALTYRRAKEGKDAQDVSYRGPVNLSGGGIYFLASDTIQLKERLDLKLFLGAEFGESACAIGQVERVIDMRRDRAGLGLRFLEIESRERDKVISFCLAEQRRLLRTRVRILDQD